VVVFLGGQELILLFWVVLDVLFVLMKKNKDLILFKSVSENYKGSSSRRSGGLFPK
jgi:hypothetical protein